MIKYTIPMLLLITCTIHAGPCFSRPAQPMPLQYIYVTPTLIDNTSQEEILTGRHSYIEFNNNTFKPLQRPSQRTMGYNVDIESATLSFNPDARIKPSLKTFLTITYSIKKRTESGIETIQKAESVTFDDLYQNGAFEKVLPQLSCTLKILAERWPVFRKQ